MDELGERHIDEACFDADDPRYKDIYPTTWQDLEDHYLIDCLGQRGRRLCVLTWGGWMEGLEITGTLETPEFRDRVERVMAALKAEVAGRRQKALAEPSSIAARARVPVGFVFNFVVSHYADLVLNRVGASWSPRENVIEIPVNFGLEPTGPKSPPG